MREAKEQDKEKLLAYLARDLQDCIYMYIDIVNYGIAAENLTVWIDEVDDEISLAVMKYYDSFQIYSHKESCNIGQVAELLAKYPVAMISGRWDIIRELSEVCQGYEATYGVVFLVDKFRDVGAVKDIELAAEEDAKEIAKLICSDREIGGHYEIQELAAQLAERIRTGTGRSYIIREKGVIVAHSATYAETEKIAVVGGTIIRQDRRNTNYYVLLSNYMIQQLKKENKSIYTFSISDKMIRYHEMLHTRCGEYGKLVLKK